MPARVYLQKIGKSYYAKFKRPDTGKWSNLPLRTTKKAVASTRLGMPPNKSNENIPFILKRGHSL